VATILLPSLLEGTSRVERSILSSELSGPGEEVFNELLVSGVCGISLTPSVVLGVDDIKEFRGALLSAEKEASSDLKLGLLTEDNDAGETILTNTIQALNESTAEVRSVQELLQIVVVLVVSEPQGVSLVKVFPEPAKSMKLKLIQHNCYVLAEAVGIGR